MRATSWVRTAIALGIVGIAMMSARSSAWSGDNPGGRVSERAFGRDPSDALGGGDMRTHGGGHGWFRGGPDL